MDSLQAELRRDALATARRRAEALRMRIAQPNARQSEEAEREARYLERVAAAVSKRPQMEAFVLEVQELSTRLSQLPLARRSVGALVKELSDGGGGAAPGTTRRMSTSSSSSTAPAVQVPFDAESSLQSNLAALGAFLFEDLPPDVAADEVRLLALEDRLKDELKCHQTLTNVGNERTVFLRSFTPIGGESTVGSRSGIVAMSFSPVDGVQVLDTIREPAEGKGSSWEWVLPAVGLVLGIGAAFLVHAPTGLGIVAATSSTTVGAKALERWQEQVLEKMKQQIPQARRSPDPDAVKALQSAARGQTKRLLRTLADQRGWKPYRFFPYRAWKLDLPILYQRSAARSRGHAFATYFKTSVKAKHVHALLEHMSMMGSLDPGCKAVWARPVDTEGTSVRYLIFSNPLCVRDFFLICRSGRAETEGDVQPMASPSEALDSPVPLPLPFCHRDRTEDFARHRARRHEHRAALVPWHERLRAALERGSSSEVLRLREAAREATSKGPRKSGAAAPVEAPVCEACGAATTAPQQGRKCEVCLSWLCGTCCSRQEDVAPFLSDARAGHLVFTCCEPCGSYVGSLLWRRFPPPACLSAPSAKLLGLHRALASSMTDLTRTFAQLDGLHRILSGDESHIPALRDCWEELPRSSDAARAARTRLEGLVREVAAVDCSGSNRTLRDQLYCMGKGHLQELKCGLAEALEAADECLQRRPGFDAGLSSWTPTSSLAERYAISMASCPSELLRYAGEETVPTPSEGIKHGSIPLLGIVATDTAEGGARVDIVADVDPDINCPFFVDQDVRGHVLFTADRLRKQIEEEQKRLEASAEAEMDLVLRLLPSLR